MQPVGRCPRCGYVLRFDGHKYSCDFCGYMFGHRSFSDRFQEFEKGVRFRVQGMLEEIRGPNPRQIATYYPNYASQRRPCVNCRIPILANAQNCPICGASQMQVRVATPPASAVSSESNEQKVYDYIVSHNGTISFSKAAQDLEMSSESLRIAIEHLKSAGLLDQT